MTALTVYQKMADPIAAVRFLGEAIAKSRLFKCENEAQGQVLAMECLTTGMTPLTLSGRHHLVGGDKLTKKAHVILADFQKYGGQFQLLSRTAERASIELSLGANKIVETLTWDEASQEAWPWSVDKKTGKKSLKDNWATPRARRQMLWARVISEGVRSICPQAAEGYAPEEFGEIAEDENETVDAPFELKPATAIDNPNKIDPATKVESPEIAAPKSARDLRFERVEFLFAALGLTDDQQSAALNKRGVSAVRQLTDDKLVDLIAKLELKLADQSRVDHVAGAINTAADSVAVSSTNDVSRVDPAAMSVAVDGPCTQTQIDAIKEAVTQWNQIQPGVAKQFAGKLQAAGVKLKDLSVAQAQRLAAAVAIKQIEAFFDKELLKPRQEHSVEETPVEGEPKN